jgi:V/A-type H+-transporting ATPase subunit I
MSIVRMKRLYAIAPVESRRSVLRSLYRLGCVEIEKNPPLPPDLGGLLRTNEENTDAACVKNRLAAACAALDELAPRKTSLFAPRTALTEGQLFDPSKLTRAAQAAEEICALCADMEEASASKTRLEARIAALCPWEPLDVALSYTGETMTAFFCGVLPCSADFPALVEEMADEVAACRLDLISRDREQHYITALVYRPDAEQAMSLLRSRGFVLASFGGLQKTAAQAIASLRGEIAALDEGRAECAHRIKAFAPMRLDLQAAFDAYSQEATRDNLLSAVGQTENTVFLMGWAPADAEQAVADALAQEGCAYSFAEPQQDESPPVTVLNNRLVDPFVSVTDMYGTPTYDSIVDPNPSMSIFYFTFFGFIMGDAMYGVVMVVLCWLYLRLKRPTGGTKRMMTMFLYCGVSTIIAGMLTGTWFADSVSAVSLWLTGRAVQIPPLWFDPLSNPMLMLQFALTLGAIQMCTGMALAAYRLIKKGQALDAVWDIGSWYVVFAGIGLMALGFAAGKYVLAAALLVILLMAGRDKKGIGRLVGGLGSLYGATGYLSDLLSYSRIMALGLSGGVVGQVINKIATMATGIPGYILFVIVFIFGHAFNIAISLLGAYVHTCRLQYIEFFGRFFEDGGRPFKPLQNNTKYVEIVKEV